MSTAHQNENAERITRSIDSDLMMLAALTLIVAALDEHVGCTDPCFITQPTACLCISAVRRRAIAPLDNGSDHRVRTEDLPFQNHAQAGLRVHRIVTWRLETSLRFYAVLRVRLIRSVVWNGSTKSTVLVYHQDGQFLFESLPFQPNLYEYERYLLVCRHRS